MAAANIKEIESEMEEIQMLMKIWNKFYKILTNTFFNKDADIKQLDPEFQQIKQVVAEHHAHFMKVIKKDFHIGQSVLTTVKRTISLEGFHNLSPLEINKTLIEWHDANILLNETLGSLECQRDKIVRGVKTKVPKAIKNKDDLLAESARTKMILNLVIILVLIGAIVVFWDTIHASSLYQSVFAGWLDPILQSVGLISPTEPATAAPAAPAQ